MPDIENPYRVPRCSCIAFSGGRTSGYMLKMILDAWDGNLPTTCIPCFANLGVAN
jgi:predicted phosphoadenosine phosphosulfate sulfurtransferase